CGGLERSPHDVETAGSRCGILAAPWLGPCLLARAPRGCSGTRLSAERWAGARRRELPVLDPGRRRWPDDGAHAHAARDEVAHQMPADEAAGAGDGDDAIADCGLRIADCGPRFRIAGCGFDCRFADADYRSPIADCRLRIIARRSRSLI